MGKDLNYDTDEEGDGEGDRDENENFDMELTLVLSPKKNLIKKKRVLLLKYLFLNLVMANDIKNI